MPEFGEDRRSGNCRERGTRRLKPRVDRADNLIVDGGRPDELYRVLFDHVDNMVCTLDLEGRFTSVNPAGERLTGYEAEELVGRLAVELIAPEHREEAVRQFLRRLDTRDELPADESVLVTRGGDRMPIEITSALLLDDGEPAGVLGLVRDLSAQRGAEHALSQSEERFRNAFEFAAIGMALVGPDGRFLQVNDSLCELVGYSADELLRRTFQEITHPGDLEADLQLADQLLAGEIRSYQMEKRYIHRLGAAVWALLSVSLVLDDEGRPIHFISQIQDITERKRAEEELATSRARLSEAQRIAQIGDWRRDGSDQPLTWSEETYRIFGIDPAEGQPTFDRLVATVHHDDRDEFVRTVQQLRKDGRPYEHEFRVVLPGGSLRWVESRGELVPGTEPPVTRGTAQDVTDDKLAEARLAEAEQRYRTLVEQLPLGMYIRPLDMSEPNIYASPQVEPMLGYPAAAWMTDPSLMERIVHPDDRRRATAEAMRVRETGVPLHEEYRYVKPDGSVVWVQDETYVVYGDDDEPQFVQGYLLDITERKLAQEERDRLREELHHAQKLEAVGRLAGGVAHDFNNMLTAIKGYAELLLDGLDPESPHHAEAEQVRRAASQASALPRQLLAFSRKQVLEPKLIDLNHVVSEAIGLIRLLLGSGVELVTDLSARAPAVVADPGQVEQVLLNLATNARDAMREGGRLTIATRNVEVDATFAIEHDAAPGPYVVVAVSDSGEGMDAATLERVFEPFFTTKGAGKGSGLGLASAYGITRQSGGFVKATSAPEQGSTFDVYLPLAVVSAPGADDEAAVDAEPVTVLLVEDEELVREFATTALERAGFRVLTASRGTEALEVCERSGVAVDVLVSDLMMPGMGGRELAERVVARNPATKVVLMSGFADESSGVDTGGVASCFLQKPFSVSALVEAVRDAVEAPAAMRRDPLPPTARRRGITCVVADDHPAVLDSVSRFLETSGIDVVARAGSGDEALVAIEVHRPAIALLDVTMAPVNGIEIARRLARAAPETAVILYTGHRDAKLLEQALDAGARGFVLKEAPLSELTRAMKAVAGGGTFVDDELSSVLAAPRSVRALSPLTDRERQVLALVADGMTNDMAAAELGISAETVQSHVRNAMGKLEADTRTQAVATALRQQLIA